MSVRDSATRGPGPSVKAFLVDAIIRTTGAVAMGFFYIFGWPLIRGMGLLAGRRAYWMNDRVREVIRQELRATFGTRMTPAQLDETTRQSLILYHSRLIEMFFLGAMTRKRIDQGVEAEGMEHVDAALSKGKGGIILLSHLGSFLLPLPYLGQHGYKINQIAGREICPTFLSRRIWEWRKRQHDRLPVQFVQIGTFMRPVYKALARNELVAIAFDGRDSSRWVTVDFFNRKADFSPGPFDMARRTGAAILPTFVIRDEHGRHKLVFEPAFALSNHPDPERGAEDDTRNFATIWKRYVEQYPAHFGMLLHRLREVPGHPFFGESVK